MLRRLLIGLLIVLVLANAAAIAAWIFRDALEEAGVLPKAEPPTRADLPPQPLPPIGAETPAEQSNQTDDDLAPSEEPPAVPPVAESEETIPRDASTAGGTPSQTSAPAASDRTQEDDVPDVKEASPQVHAADPAACVLAGAYTGRGAALRARQRLAEQGVHVDGDLVEESVAADPSHAVYIPPVANRSEAEQVASDLEKQRVNAYVIPDGEREGGVSVGVFRSEQRALAQQERVTKLGYEVRVTAVEREQLVYRVRALNAPLAALAGLPLRPCEEEQP